MSFLNELELLLERKDVPFSDDILKMTNKILSFIKKNKTKLHTVSHYVEGKAYYILYPTIDPKTKYTDLLIGLMNTNDSAINKNKEDITKMTNPAALVTYKDKETGKKDYVLRLYIFDSKEDMEKNVSKVITKITSSPNWNTYIYHELTHYFDVKRQKVTSSYNIKDFISDNEVESILNKIKKYHNLTDEINAHFIQSVTMFWHAIKAKNLDIMTLPFDKFKGAFIYFYGKNAFENLNDDNKKRILKRIYLLYNELKEAIAKKEKK